MKASDLTKNIGIVSLACSWLVQYQQAAWLSRPRLWFHWYWYWWRKIFDTSNITLGTFLCNEQSWTPRKGPGNSWQRPRQGGLQQGWRQMEMLRSEPFVLFLLRDCCTTWSFVLSQDKAEWTEDDCRLSSKMQGVTKPEIAPTVKISATFCWPKMFCCCPNK